MNQMFRSLAAFNYRVWFFGALVSNVGTWMQSTALSWVVLTELTDDDAGAMGLTLAIRFTPPLLFVALTGWIVDRFDRRRLLMVTQTLLGLSSVAIGTMLLTGTMTLPVIYLFAFVTGVFTAIDNPARQTFVSDVVGSQLASNAVALNSASFNTARMAGPAVSGLLIVAVGSGWVFLIDALTFIAMLVALMIIRPNELQPRPRRGSGGRLSDGFRYAKTRPDLLVIFVIILLIGALAMNFPIYASTMALEFGREADGFGLLSSVLAIGSLAGALMAAKRARARFRVVVAATGAFAVIAAVSAVMPDYWTYAVLLIGVGFTTVTTLTTANGYVQTTTPPEVRGRVMAIYMAILMGGTPLGAPLVGWVADAWSPRAAIFVGAGGALAACIIGLVWMVASGRLHRHPERSFALALDDTRAIRVVDPAPEEFSDAAADATPLRPGSGARGRGRCQPDGHGTDEWNGRGTDEQTGHQQEERRAGGAYRRNEDDERGEPVARGSGRE